MAFDPTQAVLPGINKDTLIVIQQYGEDLSDIQDEIILAEAALSNAKSRFNEIATKTLPDLMNEIGIEELKLKDGSLIRKSDVVYARIKNPDVAFNWLKSQGEDSIIDNTFTLKFKKGEEAAVLDLKEILEVFDINYTNKQDVHWKRLESFIKDVIADPVLNQSLPREAFGVHEGEIVKFKKPII